ncbi:uncharacterized protein LOC116288346 [Actinia tenebrosa]|uniref:Uncharacterized protein LOC116288346 n=1 Tax=Actinia tenebrosa TaxID=6105 RepID=A0A6P8H3M9_ACTTE|nr:uncharacterized protein LOC116288346 [Actinia tenebrosa]
MDIKNDAKCTSKRKADYGRDGLYLVGEDEKSKASDARKYTETTTKTESSRFLSEFEEDELIAEEEKVGKGTEKKEKKKKKKDQLDELMAMMPTMTEAVTKAAKAHEKAVSKWRGLSISDSD